MADYVNASLAQERLIALLSGFFGGVGLLLAGVGVSGVTSYTVNLRRKDRLAIIDGGGIPTLNRNLDLGTRNAEPGTWLMMPA